MHKNALEKLWKNKIIINNNDVLTNDNNVL